MNTIEVDDGERENETCSGIRSRAAVADVNAKEEEVEGGQFSSVTPSFGCFDDDIVEDSSLTQRLLWFLFFIFLLPPPTLLRFLITLPMLIRL